MQGGHANVLYDCTQHQSGAQGPPQFSKKRSENACANESLSYGFPSIPGIAPGVAPRIVVFVLLKSWDAILRMECRIPRMEFEFRELLREYPGTLRELREWPFHSESFFLEIGVAPRLLNQVFATQHKDVFSQSQHIRESFCESGEGVRLPRERGRPPGKSGKLPGESGKVPGTL